MKVRRRWGAGGRCRITICNGNSDRAGGQAGTISNENNANPKSLQLAPRSTDRSAPIGPPADGSRHSQGAPMFTSTRSIRARAPDMSAHLGRSTIKKILQVQVQQQPDRRERDNPRHFHVDH
jgi:hypothetical protein